MPWLGQVLATMLCGTVKNLCFFWWAISLLAGCPSHRNCLCRWCYRSGWEGSTTGSVGPTSPHSPARKKGSVPCKGKVQPWTRGRAEMVLAGDQDTKSRYYCWASPGAVVPSLGSCPDTWGFTPSQVLSKSAESTCWEDRKGKSTGPAVQWVWYKKSTSSFSVFIIQLSELLLKYLEECVVLPTDRFKEQITPS